MIQNIVALSIVFIAAGFIVYKILHPQKKKIPSKCEGCKGCEIKELIGKNAHGHCSG